MVAVADPSRPPAVALKLAEAMTVIGFNGNLVPLVGPAKSQADFAIFVGTKPL
jgi:hypothetical protein